MLKLARSSKMDKLALMLNLNKKQVASFDLPCGYTCPCAYDCKTFANPVTMKLEKPSYNKFNCYGANLEIAFTATRNLHWHNYNLLKHCNSSGEMADMILASINPMVKIMRIHSFGDYFSKRYFQAWVKVTEQLPNISFFSYTKVLPYVKEQRPKNFAMVYSHGGKMDSLVTDEPVAYVINSIEDGKKMGIPIACQENPADDYNFVIAKKSFGLVIHGNQPRTAKGIIAV